MLDSQKVFYHRRWQRQYFTSTPPERMLVKATRPAWYKNPVVVAVELNEKLKSLPLPSKSALADRVGLSRGRISQFLQLLDLPAEILSFMLDPKNTECTRMISEEALRALLKLQCPNKICYAFALLIKAAPDKGNG